VRRFGAFDAGEKGDSICGKVRPEGDWRVLRHDGSRSGRAGGSAERRGGNARTSRAIPEWSGSTQAPDRVPAQLEEDVRFVLRRLIEQLGRPPPEPGDRPLVLEVELEGLRCLFMLEPSVRAESTLSPREQQIARMVA
jgi:hypothetical protein